VRVSELSGVLLDYWVARAEAEETLKGSKLQPAGENRWTIVDPDDDFIMGYLVDGIQKRFKARRELNLDSGTWHYWPSGDWAYGGPLMEREKIGVTFGAFGGLWHALVLKEGVLGVRSTTTGPTPLVAAMRAYVISKFGEEVPEAEKQSA